MTAATGPQASGYDDVVDLSRYPINDPADPVSAWPLSGISTDHRAVLLTVRNRLWTQIRRASPPL